MKPTYEELEAQVKQLAAENAALKNFIIRDCHVAHIEPETFYEVEAIRYVIADGYEPETPATDAYLSQLRNDAMAEAIPEGYVLVPQQIFLDPSDIESICTQCGNGAENEYGNYCDGLLWVGNIQDDGGNITHGLHISSADYPEDGGITLHAFPNQLREGKAGEVQS